MSARGRWRALVGASDRVLGDLLADEAIALRARRAELSMWARLAGLPEGEVVASPFGARMIALGLEVGATTVHHELRPLLRWHPSLLPDDSVVDPVHGRWHRGALRTGKYQEFCQEEPFCAYHPEHSAKWAPHEWLHRAAGFFHRANASGLERYVGARLNELLPVATWYGLEEALRLDHEGPFDRAREGREPGAERDRARWLDEPERTLRARARAAAPLVRWTLARAASELEAIDHELATGKLRPSVDAGLESFPNVRLDASSDALAYVHAHGRRLEAPLVASVLEALAGTLTRDVRVLRARLERVLDRLLFAPLRLSPRAIERRILANVPLDLVLRAATQGPSVEASVRAALPEARRARRMLTAGAGPTALEPLRARLAEALSPHIGARRTEDVLTLGMLWPSRSVATGALRQGMGRVLPMTSAHLGRRRSRLADALAERAASLGSRRPLGLRVAALLGDEGATLRDRALADLARLEHAIATAGGVEPRAAWPERHGAAARVRLVRDARFTFHHFGTDVLAAHRGEALRLGETVVAVGLLDDGVVLVALPKEVADHLEGESDGSWSEAGLARALGGRDVVAALVEARVLLRVSLPAR